MNRKSKGQPQSLLPLQVIPKKITSDSPPREGMFPQLEKCGIDYFQVATIFPTDCYGKWLQSVVLENYNHLKPNPKIIIDTNIIETV